MQCRFHSVDGTVTKEDSGVWIQPVDALGFTPLAKVPHFAGAEEFQCDGSYCGLPYYYAKRAIFRRNWYLRGEKPEQISQFAFQNTIYTREEKPNGVVRFHFNIPGPDHMVLFLTLHEGTELADWSFYKFPDERHIVRTLDYMGGYTHIVFYTHGYMKENHQTTSWKFWMDFKRLHSPGTLGELGVARHYLHGGYSRSRLLNASIDALPEWVHDNSWCSNYDSYTLA